MTEVAVVLAIVVAMCLACISKYDKDLKKAVRIQQMYRGSIDVLVKDRCELHSEMRNASKADESRAEGPSPTEVMESCNKEVADNYEAITAYDKF